MPGLQRLKIENFTPQEKKKIPLKKHYKLKAFALKTAQKIIPLLLSLGLLSFVVLKVEPPKSLSSATTIQLLSLFVSLFLSVYFLLNFSPLPFIRKIIFALLLVAILLLQGLNMLNIFSAVLIIASVIFLLKVTHKPAKSNYQSKIPRISNLSKK